VSARTACHPASSPKASWVSATTPLPADAGFEAERAAALERLEAWRRRAAHPLTDRATAETCEVIAHSYERLYGELASPSV
jgi:hypothetical protein